MEKKTRQTVFLAVPADEENRHWQTNVFEDEEMALEYVRNNSGYAFERTTMYLRNHKFTVTDKTPLKE